MTKIIWTDQNRYLIHRRTRHKSQNVTCGISNLGIQNWLDLWLRMKRLKGKCYIYWNAIYNDKTWKIRKFGHLIANFVFFKPKKYFEAKKAPFLSAGHYSISKYIKISCQSFHFNAKIYLVLYPRALDFTTNIAILHNVNCTRHFNFKKDIR